jgi:hypothetical protein
MSSTNLLSQDRTDGVVIGAPVTVTLFGRDVAISQTNQRRAGFKAPYDLIPLSFQVDNTARVATASVKLRNVTDAADVFANVVATSASAVRSTTVVAGQTIVQKDDVLELQATTDGTGTITDLQAQFTYIAAGVPDNRTA